MIRLYARSAAVLALNVGGSLLNLALDAYWDRRKPTPPAAVHIPRQRVTSLFYISADEREAFIRAAACNALGREMPADVHATLAAMVDRARDEFPDVAAEHDADCWAEWERELRKAGGER